MRRPEVLVVGALAGPGHAVDHPTPAGPARELGEFSQLAGSGFCAGALVENDNTTVLQTDLRNGEEIYDDPATRALIDFGQPVAVMFSATLHHLNDDEDPASLVKFWVGRIPSGSYVFISHFRSLNDPHSAEIQRFLQESFGRGRWRTNDEIRALFAGLELLEPGIVPAAEWRPNAPLDDELTDWQRLIVAGLAVKP